MTCGAWMPEAQLVFSDEEVQQLQALADQRAFPTAIVKRTNILVGLILVKFSNPISSE